MLMAAALLLILLGANNPRGLTHSNNGDVR
jgi:hypothetical protein